MSLPTSGPHGMWLSKADFTTWALHLSLIRSLPLIHNVQCLKAIVFDVRTMWMFGKTVKSLLIHCSWCDVAQMVFFDFQCCFKVPLCLFLAWLSTHLRVKQHSIGWMHYSLFSSITTKFWHFWIKCLWLFMFRYIYLSMYFQLLEYKVICAQLSLKPWILFQYLLPAMNELSPYFTSLSQNLVLPKLCSLTFPVDVLWCLIDDLALFVMTVEGQPVFMCSFSSFLSSLLKLHCIYGSFRSHMMSYL